MSFFLISIWQVMLRVNKPDSLMAEPIAVVASSLVPNDIYELVLRLNHSTGTFLGRGLYKADERGVIDISKSAPLRGTYSGIRSMGLFESLMPCEDFRFGGFCKCTPPVPFNFTLELRNCTGDVLQSMHLLKRWLHPYVTRIEIEDDGICGTLFKPPGDGPFPSIIEISGAGGDINEHKGAALASQGFCVLSLVFFQYKTLVKNLNDVDLDYFKKAINWMTSQKFVPNEIGFHGISLGGLLVNLIAIRNPQVIAVCSINGSHVITEMVKIKEHGEYLPFAECHSDYPPFVNQTMFLNKVVDTLHVTPETDIGIKTAPQTTAFRFVVSLDDYSTPTILCTRYLEEALKNSSHYVEVDFVPGGHIMDPPYLPCAIQALGGEPSQHGAVQSRVWSNTIAFFERLGPITKLIWQYNKEMKSLTLQKDRTKLLFRITDETIDQQGKTCVAWRPNGNTLALARYVVGMAWDKEGDVLGVISSASSLAILWNINTHSTEQLETAMGARKIPVLGKHQRKITDVAITRQDEILCCSDDNAITVSSADGETLKTLVVSAEPNDMKVGEVKRPGGNVDIMISAVLGKKTLFLSSLAEKSKESTSPDGDVDTSMNLQFQEKYGHIVAHVW
ncbi:hypothetical protein KIN20_000169 [Parelaphostrongylus tenuis]|uniref:Uncharacterized protein n=1 Tax=Parelaphostrongylus tenuis TaxID=148309 RepID=A0AAD5QBA8_PARTN|nr:hypothetical protein KIN20_000169 [Parelaphostrongylus tenuis]